MTGAVAAVAIALQLVNVNSQGVQGDGHSIWADVSPHDRNAEQQGGTLPDRSRPALLLGGNERRCREQATRAAPSGPCGCADAAAPVAGTEKSAAFVP
jgi:hypothetical protein